MDIKILIFLDKLLKYILFFSYIKCVCNSYYVLMINKIRKVFTRYLTTSRHPKKLKKKKVHLGELSSSAVIKYEKVS